jgi:alkylation response protein AidB-like acyl-CoA dehydrogenase
MDLSLSEEQQSISDLAGQILTDKLPPQRIREIETDPAGRWFADDVWNELAKADLLGVCLPESVGGGGYGFMEACLLLEQQGRTVAPLPLLPTLVLGALPVARFGTTEQQAALLPGVIDGSTILTAALFEAGDYVVPDQPATAATEDASGWTIEGEKILVPAAHLASRILVPARANGSVSVFLVDPSKSGVETERNIAINDEPLFTVRMDGAPAELLGGEEIVEWIASRAVAALCSIQVGVCDAALRLTATYVSEREQFGAKIGTFQAVAQRIAEELPASDELHIAKFWASFGGDRVVHAAQHLHGGVGVDLDYPIHRYFRWSKVNELLMGTATEHLRRLGQRIAASP